MSVINNTGVMWLVMSVILRGDDYGVMGSNRQPFTDKMDMNECD